MTAPNMATLTASLEKSLQNWSISSNSRQPNDATSSSSPSSAAAAVDADAATLELNSHISLPYQWEQCLDLKTGEIYYINWQNGRKTKEDPRKATGYEGEYYSEEDSSEEESEGGGGGSYSSASSSSSPTRDNFRYGQDHVLVVAGCKSCLMYLMLPKRVVQCPKCNGTIMHFDRAENGCF